MLANCRRPPPEDPLRQPARLIPAFHTFDRRPSWAAFATTRSCACTTAPIVSDRVTEPSPGAVANITPIRDRAGTPTGWRLRPLFVMQGSKSKIWPTPAEVVASTKLMTPGQARAAINAADHGGCAMNYIARLQADLAAAAAALSATTEAIQEFRVHLAGDKFAGTDTDGSRKDWIATGDVHAWLARITAAGT